MGLERHGNKWRARIMIKGKLYVKSFEKKEDAVIWLDYAKKNQKLFIRSEERLLPVKGNYIIKTGQKVLDELAEVDGMSGTEFEEYCMDLLYKSGLLQFAAFYKTKKSGDFGADIIIDTAYGHKITVQCKRFKKSPVGVDAVQEVVGSKSYYKAKGCAIMTNSNLTEQALTLAEANKVLVIDQKRFVKLIEIKNRNLKTIRNMTQWQKFVDEIEGIKGGEDDEQ